jgi:hypothetical protein
MSASALNSGLPFFEFGVRENPRYEAETGMIAFIGFVRVWKGESHLGRCIEVDSQRLR